MTRCPSPVSWASVTVTPARSAGPRVQRARTASGAPDTARMIAPSLAFRARDTSLRTGSNGNAATSGPVGAMPAAARASSVSMGSRRAARCGWLATAVARTARRSPVMVARQSRFSVSVPVLSVTRVVTAPRVSPARSRRSSAPCRASCRPPSASSSVIRIGSSSGTVANATVRPASSMSRHGCPAARPTAGTSTLAAIAATSTARASCDIAFCSGVGGSRVPAASRPSLPSPVAWPVATTTAVPSPASTAVPACSRLDRPASPVAAGTGCSLLPTGAASPVSVDSSTRRPRAASTRASAGTTSPAPTATTSPGTRLAAGTSDMYPSRWSRAVGAVIARSASIARPARTSVTVSVTATAAMIAAIAIASRSSPNTADSTATAISSSCSGSVNDSPSSSHHGSRLRRPSGRFGP